MWQITRLVATDADDNAVVIDKNRVMLSVVGKNKKRLCKKIKLTETPPCLSVAINDLLKLLAKEDTA